MNTHCSRYSTRDTQDINVSMMYRQNSKASISVMKQSEEKEEEQAQVSSRSFIHEKFDIFNERTAQERFVLGSKCRCLMVFYLWGSFLKGISKEGCHGALCLAH